MPKELPAWFTQLDTDGDAQIGLYEWKDEGRSLEEFAQIDRNNDGFLTVQEVMRHIAVTKARPSSVKGVFVHTCTLSATMSPPVRIDLREFTAAAA